ncbi:MAG: 16S rRNA (guanine(966)-N(2))-methyltransferase RsmD [Epulopiscium sp.]|jgi:16S rRNA (guanine966-N2)-methyltransferase|nr:16S rRNA (guanine(966)-N(2))-methyltransferase RsmD [Candidatus Epulonipiscium sp.]
MRVIAGSAKGHKLKTPEGFKTRPTTDRIKETLFNMLAFDLPGCDFLDLFAGSGAIGIEALSRGAKQAFFVDESSTCAKIIHENLEHTKLSSKGEIIQKDVFSGLLYLMQQNVQFDIIFMDPPYGAGLALPVLEKIMSYHLLKKDGYVVVEDTATIPLEPPEGFYVVKEKKYKTTILTWLSLEEQTEC